MNAAEFSVYWFDPDGNRNPDRNQAMADINISFCRSLLTAVGKDIKAYVPGTRIYKDAWVWCAGRDHWEFHGPENYYWHGSADNAYDARAKGWQAWLHHKFPQLE